MENKNMETLQPKRRCTYAARRELAKQRRDEVRELEFDLAVLNSRSLSPEETITVDPVLQEAVLENKQLSYKVQNEQLKFAKAQSLLARCQSAQESHPLYTRIFLPKEWTQRRVQLMQIREEKLKNAHSFMLGTSSVEDSHNRQYSDERFETAQGDLCGVRLETATFPGVSSIQQVFDAIMLYFSSNEICILKHLGHTTVRDERDCIDGKIYNSRVLSTNEAGVTVEASTLVLPHLSPDGRYGMVVVDSVDDDECYPYKPNEHVRKDISAAIVVKSTRLSRNGVKEEDSDLGVTMRRAAFVKIHRPQFSMPDNAIQMLGEEIMSWGDVMLKTVWRTVYGFN